MLTAVALFFSIIPILAQEKTTTPEPEKLTVKVGGYIRTETFYDTYRSSESRDGESYSYPLKQGFDAAGNDTNKINQFTMLGVQSRFKISASGISAFGAKVSGLIEADFMGMSDDSKFMTGLRHAYFKLDWQKTQLMLGQYWSPMSIPEFAANTVLFASGTTFQPTNRAVQARLTYQAFTKVKLMGAIMAYNTHRAVEPKYNNAQRNSGLPVLEGQVQYGSVNEFFFSFNVGYKFLKPYLETVASGSKYKATKIVGSYHSQACIGYQLPNLSLKVQGNYGQNMTEFGLIGGYLPVEGTVNTYGEYDYTNIKTVSTWFDIETKGKKFKPGLFIGYSENLGTDKDVHITKQYVSELTKGSDIRKLFRISPRFYYISGPVDIGVEYIRNTAAYGTFGKRAVINTQTPTVNNRIMVSVRYTF
jgi:hypothetical protein